MPKTSKKNTKLAQLLEKVGDIDTRQISVKGAPKGLFTSASAAGLEEDLTQAWTATQLTELLVELRRQRQLTLQQVGQRLGVSKGRVSQIEAKGANLKLDTLVRYVQALDAEIEIRIIPKEREAKSKAMLTRLG